jgi:hypothetical protein
MEVLVDYWAGAAPTEEAERVEEHAFACDACSSRLAGVARLADGVSRVATRRGGLRLAVTETLLDQLAADGLRMRHYHLAPGGSVACTVAPDDDLLVAHVSGDFPEGKRLDVVVYEHGKEILRTIDAPVDRKAGKLVYTISGNLARTFPKMTHPVSVFAVEGDSSEELCSYTFNHSPWPSEPVPVVVSRSAVDALRARGLRIEEYALSPRERMTFAFPADTDVVVHRLTGMDLASARRVRVTVRVESSGEVLFEELDAPVDARGEVLVTCQRHFTQYPPDILFELLATAASGEERSAEYPVMHVKPSSG